MKIVPIYDRTTLIHMTTHTVREVVIMGIILVTTLLLVFLGNVRISFIAAASIPLSLLFAFMMMVMTGRSANLISIGAIDFGILEAKVFDAVACVLLQRVERGLSARFRRALW